MWGAGARVNAISTGFIITPMAADELVGSRDGGASVGDRQSIHESFRRGSLLLLAEHGLGELVFEVRFVVGEVGVEVGMDVEVDAVDSSGELGVGAVVLAHG